MSYSFSFRAGTKNAVLAQIVERLDKLVTEQPIHHRDRQQIEAHVTEVVGALSDKPGFDVAVSMNGYISTVDGEVTALNVGASASLVPSIV